MPIEVKAVSGDKSKAEVIFLSPLKAESPIDVKFVAFAKLTEVKPVQVWKAFVPMVLSEVGRESDEAVVQFWKA